MRWFSLLLVVLSLSLPVSVKATGWRDLPKPVILSADSVVNGQSLVRFSLPKFANHPVKVFAMLRYRVDKSKEHPAGVAWSNQKSTTTLDKSGMGSILLKNLSNRKTYRVMVSMNQTAPHIEHSQSSDLKHLRTKK